jgi:hypothetical protein
MKKFISVALATLLIATTGTTTAYTEWAHTAMINASTYLGSATVFTAGFTTAGILAYRQGGSSDLGLYWLPIGAALSLAGAKMLPHSLAAYSPIITIALAATAVVVETGIGGCHHKSELVPVKKSAPLSRFTKFKKKCAHVAGLLAIPCIAAAFTILPTIGGLGAVHLANSIY